MVQVLHLGKSILATAVAAAFSVPLWAQGEPVTWENVTAAEVFRIGDRDLLFEGIGVSTDTRVTLELGEGIDLSNLSSASMLNLRNVGVDEGARLTVSLKNNGNDHEETPMRGYWCGASFVPTQEREGSWGLDVEAETGTVFVLGSHSDGSVLDPIASEAWVWFEDTDGHPRSLMVFQESLKLYKEDRYAIGSTIEEAERRDANLLVGRYGVLVVDEAHLDLSGALIEAQDGAKIKFEKNSAIFITDAGGAFDGETLGMSTPEPAPETNSEEGRIEFFNPGAHVEGLDDVVIVNGVTGTEGHFVANAAGGLTLVVGDWKADGAMAAPVNALHRNRTSPGSERFFDVFPVSAWAERAVITNTLLAKSLGTTQAMGDRAADGAQFARGAFLKDPTLMPVNVELTGGRSRGKTVEADGGVGTFDRDTAGLALSVRGVAKDWLWGVRVLYEDANIDIDGPFVKKEATDAESTLLAGSLYLGKKVERLTLVGDVTFAGAEDRVDFFQTGDVKIGADDISRRSVSAGVTGLYEPKTDIFGFAPLWRAGLQLTDYLKTDYDVAIDGDKVWEVEEKNRLVATADVGVELKRDWHLYTRVPGEKDGEWRTRDDWLSLGVTGGMRVRAGDLDSPQRVTAAGASAEIETADLARWETYAGLGLDASWHDALWGLSAEGLWGPDKREACRFRLSLVWNF